MNVSDQISVIANKYPYKRSVIMPVFTKKGHYAHYTFWQLENRINQLALYFKASGVKKQMRVLLFVKPSLDFSAITFALFKIGAVPIFIDPGMGFKNVLGCISQTDPEVLIGEDFIHLARLFLKKHLEGIKLFFSVGKISLFETRILPEVCHARHYYMPSVMPEAGDLAAILFTSGGTGTPKGVMYTHDIFIHQTKVLKEIFALTENDMDVPGFPLFALFTLSMGMSSTIPDMNPSRPSKANAEKLLKVIEDQGASFVAGSPAIWERLADYCLKHKREIPSLKSVVMFGAPISVSLHEKFAKILPNGTTYTPYGATECLPVSNISGQEILLHYASGMNKGLGICIGREIGPSRVEIIKETTEIISDWNDSLILPRGEVGEIIVKSNNVTPGYFRQEGATKNCKIYDTDGIWHRMGDVGYKDHNGMIWFCGRKGHVVNLGEKRHYTIPVESIYNQHPEVKRSALVSFSSHGEKQLGLIVERVDGKQKLPKNKRDQFFSELIKLGLEHPHTQDISHFFVHPRFPVDVRHNIKIDRIKLSEWLNEHWSEQ